MTFVFVKGDEVLLRARPASGTGVVTDVLMTASEPQYKVYFAGGTQVYSARHLELAAGTLGTEVDPVALLHDGALADAETFRAFMTLAKLEKPLADNLYSFAASRTQRLPHQFKAVLKLLANHGFAAPRPASSALTTWSNRGIPMYAGLSPIAAIAGPKPAQPGERRRPGLSLRCRR